MRSHSCVWWDIHWPRSLPLIVANIHYLSVYLPLKRFVKCMSGYSQYYIFLLFQVAFNTKQKLITGLELSLAHCVSMVTDLRCSSSEFSLNDLGSLCDPGLLNLDYYVPSRWPLTYTLQSLLKEAVFLHCVWNIWTRTLLFQCFLPLVMKSTLK